MGTPLYRKSLMIFLSTLCFLAMSTLHVQAELNIVATTEHYGALTKIVGADKVKVSVLVRGGPESACRRGQAELLCAPEPRRPVSDQWTTA